MNTIRISEITDGMILFKDGKTLLAKGIKLFQWLRFKGVLGKENKFISKLNHVGIFVRNKDGDLDVYEQDNPGKFQSSSFDYEYSTEDVYVGVPVIPYNEDDLVMLRKDMRRLAGNDDLLNYSYKSYFGFIYNTFGYKLTGKDLGMRKSPKGTTCSQITVKFIQKYLNRLNSKKWWRWYPCELAMHKDYELRKLVK